MLPSQNAILLGWASELPVLVRMNDLPKEHQPRSDDPEFWDVWTGEEERDIDWKAIADDWQGIEQGSDGNLSISKTGSSSNSRDDDAEDTIDPDDLPF